VLVAGASKELKISFQPITGLAKLGSVKICRDILDTDKMILKLSMSSTLDTLDLIIGFDPIS
jgi:hypothetical protein